MTRVDISRLGTTPVVAIDIDGTIADFHRHFLRFAEQWYGRPMPPPEAINPGLPLHKHMQTSKATYRKCKLAYRQGGLKRSMPIYPNAAEMIRNLRRARFAEVWLTTTRPYLAHNTIDEDTRHWLRRNSVQYDGIIYGEHKYRDLAKTVGRNRIAAVLEDLPEMCIQAMACRLPTVLRDAPYNNQFGYRKVPDGEDILDVTYRAKFGQPLPCDGDYFVGRAANLYDAEGMLTALVKCWYASKEPI